MADTEQDDVVDVLTADHHQVLDFLATIGDVTQPQQRRDIADTVIAEVVRHSVAEEMYVYPAMRQHLEDGDDEVRHDIEEHQQLEKTMKELERADATDLRFGELVDQLAEQLRHHAQDEEQDQFPQLRKSMARADLVELGQRVQQAKQIAPTRPHPGAPHTELFHKALGPGVGLVDKLRDALSGRARNV